jgi:site-specific recombinase XerD
MTQNYVSVVFDRKKKANTNKSGKGKIELYIRLNRECRKYLTIGECTPAEWKTGLFATEAIEKQATYELKMVEFVKSGVEQSLDNLNRFLSIGQEAKKSDVVSVKPDVPKRKRGRPKNPLKDSFLDFMRDEIIKEHSKDSTKRQKMVALDALERWGKIKTFEDLTPAKLRAWDEWLREDGTRSDPAVHNYHKRTKPYVRLAYEKGIIEKEPYSMCHFPRGKSKERRPLTENELKRLRDAELPEKEAKVRDLFIFAAYTGLAFCDVMEFNFRTMTEQSGDMYFIDGSRLKTGTNFFTPILPPAMDVLIRYDFKLPKISNQKANDYLHIIESRLGINKSMTFHVARHSFATLSLSHDVPIEKVARMLGHTDIKTTQIYAKILKTTVEKHAFNLSNAIL